VFRQIAGPNNAAASYANPFTALPTFPGFVPYSPTTALSFAGLVDPGYATPMTQQFGLNLQTKLSRSVVWELAYIGSRTTHNVNTVTINQALLASPANPIRGQTTNTLANVAQRVPFQGFIPTGLSQIQTNGAGWYHGLETSLTKRLSQGLQFVGAYTFSHEYSTDAAFQLSAFAGAATVGDQTKPATRYGRVPYNRDHRVTVRAIYDFPKVTSFSSLANAVLSGWEVSSVTVFQSGEWLTPVNLAASNVFGAVNDLAQIVPGCDPNLGGSIQGKRLNYVNRACYFTTPGLTSPLAPPTVAGGGGPGFAVGAIGNVKGPDQSNTDMALIKNTYVRGLGQEGSLQLRAEFFNVFNHPIFSNPASMNVTSPVFGRITSTVVSPRIIQLALRLSF
jgi:hypothetical protein